jgi:hypothetical protein
MLEEHLSLEPKKLVWLGTRFVTTIEWDRWETKRLDILKQIKVNKKCNYNQYFNSIQIMENMKITITLEYLIENFECDIAKGIQYCKDSMVDIPKKPIEPKLYNNKPTLEQIELYSKNSKEYPLLMEEYQILNRKNQYYNFEITSLIEEFIKSESGLKKIPKEYQDKVWSNAYNDGHSDGYYEVYLKLISLVEIFD